jgi:DNA replication protein DnaC
MIGPKPKQFPTVAHTPKLSPLGFYVCGATGVGKSRFSAAFIFEHLDLWTWIDAYYYPPKMRVSIEWVNCPDLYLDITDAYATHRSIKSIIERYRAPRLLVLDDAGAEKVSASTLQSFYWILSKRLENQKQTIVTSNLTLQEWHDRDPRIASRLCALGTYHMKGLDWRTLKTDA